MKSQRSGFLVSFACGLALLALAALAAMTAGASTTPAPIAPPAASAEAEHPAAVILLGVDGEPKVLIFVSSLGKRLFVPVEVCAASTACMGMYTILKMLGAIDKLDMHSRVRLDDKPSVKM